MQKWTPPEGLADAYQAGTSANALAQQHGVSQNTVIRHLREAGIPIRSDGGVVAQMPLAEMQRLYEAGYSAKEIGARASISLQTVQRRLAKAGVRIRTRSEKTPVARAKISAARRMAVPEGRLRELHSQGMSCRDMAPLLDCDEETVRRRLIELDLPRLPGKARPERNAFWRGGYAVDEQGYILKHQPDHPQATTGGYVRLHRLVMEDQLGRLLLPEEVVDHRNGDTSDNDPSNLRLFASNAEHLRATLTGRRKLPTAERERLRQEAVQRAHQRVAAILAA